MEETARCREELMRLPIKSDPRLQPVEKETSFNLLGTEHAFSVFSYHPSVIRGLLRQPEFEVTSAFIERIRGKETLVGIQGRLPIASVHIGASRTRRSLSAVFSRRSQSGKGGKHAPATQTAPIEPDLWTAPQTDKTPEENAQ